jgi:O-antigen ligase
LSYFVVLLLTYTLAAIVDRIELTRFLSLVCVFGYYIFVISCYDSIEKLVKDVNRALLLTIGVGIILYVFGNENVTAYESATKIVFKGIVANRNSYSGFTLLYIATNFYLWRKEKKFTAWRIITTLVAIVTTVMTGSATSIICIALLLLLLCGCKVKELRRWYSFRIFAIAYVVIFAVLVLSNSTELKLLEFIAKLFGKSTTLTGRTDLWVVAMDIIVKSPLFGFGYDNTQLISHGMKLADPHNSLLYIAMTQGFIGIVGFGAMLFFVVRNDKNLELKKNDAYMCMFSFVIIWFIRGLVESIFSYSHFIFWFALIVMELSKSEERR